jgi:hypothetical protein
VSTDSGYPPSTGADGSAGAVTMAFAGLLTMLALPFGVGVRTIRLLFRVACRVARSAGAIVTAIGAGLGGGAVLLVRAVSVLVAPIRRWLGRLLVGALALTGAVAGAMLRRVATMRQGALVAFGTARHRVSVVSTSGSRREPAWLNGLTEVVADSVDPSTDRGPDFTIELFQNEFLAPGQTRIDAIVSVGAEAQGRDAGSPEMVEVLMLDCSASMGHPWAKIRAARLAAIAAVDALSDGVWFAVVRGAESAEVVYPRQAGLVRASPKTKRAAARVIRTLQPVGGTAIGRWLTVTRDLMALRPRAIHHAILVTDGKDEDETELDFDGAIAACEGRFQCDCRGVGTDWMVSELRKVSSSLLGSIDIIPRPALMEQEFRRMVEGAMDRKTEASMRVWVPRAARIDFVRMVSPAILDLTTKGRTVGSQVIDYPTGAWAAEQRAYHLCFEVTAAPVGSEMLASRVRLMVGDTIRAEGLIRARWTEDRLLWGPAQPVVAYYSDQAEMARTIQDGLRSKRAEDQDAATQHLARAVNLAADSGNAPVAELLARVVDVDDDGTVRLKHDVERSDEMALDTRSTRTLRQSGRSFLDERPAAPQPTADLRDQDQVLQPGIELGVVPPGAPDQGGNRRPDPDDDRADGDGGAGAGHEGVTAGVAAVSGEYGHEHGDAEDAAQLPDGIVGARGHALFSRPDGA